MQIVNLFLADLASMSEAEVKMHIVIEYAEEDSRDSVTITEQLEDYDILIAYESVGSWGCDSASYFLLKHKVTGIYQEFMGSHCSCYGFEGQFNLQEAPIEYLHSDRFNIYCGGYDNNETENQAAVKAFVASLEKEKDNEGSI